MNKPWCFLGVQIDPVDMEMIETLIDRYTDSYHGTKSAFVRAAIRNQIDRHLQWEAEEALKNRR